MIDFNTLGLLFGMMVLVAAGADRVLSISGSIGRAFIQGETDAPVYFIGRHYNNSFHVS